MDGLLKFMVDIKKIKKGMKLKSLEIPNGNARQKGDIVVITLVEGPYLYYTGRDGMSKASRDMSSWAYCDTPTGGKPSWL